MITGLEPLLGPAVAKAAGAGAARLVGWGAKETMAERRRRKIRALTHSRARAEQLEALAALPPEQMEKVESFCESIDLEHISGALSRAYLLEGSGRSSEKFAQSIRTEFDASLATWLGDETPPLVGEALYAALTESVTKTVAPLLTRPKLAPSLEAELISTAGSCAAASMRNAELLRDLNNLAEMRSFEHDYRNQAAAVHRNMRLPHAGTAKQVPYDDLFVQPMIKLESESPETRWPSNNIIHIEDLLCHTPRLVLLGDPGGGKSTLSRKLTSDLANSRLPQLKNRVPFYLELRNYASAVRGRNRRTLVQQLEETCKSPYNLNAPENAVEYLLLNDRAVVILDGLDELLDVSLRRNVVEAVEGFAHLYPTCPMLVTSRRVGYAEAALDDNLFEQVSLDAFQQNQVVDYVDKWFRLDERVERSNKERLAKSFVLDSQFVSDLRVNPLMLSLMCGIYASEHYIPRNRPDVYEKCALLLFEKWDKQRGITPELSFDAHVQSALRALALHIFEKESAGGIDSDATDTLADEGMSRTELIRFFSQYLRKKRFDNDEDAETAAIEFLEFCKGRAWVLTDVGAETYGFTHRTFLEYFAASQLVRLHTSASSLYDKLKHKVRAGESDVVAQLAVQILGKTAEDGADDFLELLIGDSAGSTMQDNYATSFAARALTFIVPRPQVLKDICINAVRLRLESPIDDADKDLLQGTQKRDAVDELFNCSIENAPRVASVVREIIGRAFENDDVPERMLFLAFMQRSRVLDSQDGASTWRAENITAHASVIDKYCSQYYWVALLALDAGKIDLEVLFEMHGVNSLYETSVTGQHHLLPLTYRLVRRLDRGKYRAVSGEVIPKARADAILVDLIKLLPRQTVPWTETPADTLAPPLVRGSARHDSRLVKKGRILMALPALEMFDEDTIFGLSSLDQQLISARCGDGQLPAEVATIFEDDPAAHKFLIRWASRKISVHRIADKKRTGVRLFE